MNENEERTPKLVEHCTPVHSPRPPTRVAVKKNHLIAGQVSLIVFGFPLSPQCVNRNLSVLNLGKYSGKSEGVDFQMRKKYQALYVNSNCIKINLGSECYCFQSSK